MSTVDQEHEKLELPIPEEKMLRSPTFFEKYPWAKSTVIVLILITAIVLSLVYVFQKETSTREAMKNEEAFSSISPKMTDDMMKDKMSDWKVYASSEGGFSFSYPSEYKIVSFSSPRSVEISKNLNDVDDVDFEMMISSKPAANKTLQQLISLNPICETSKMVSGSDGVINGQNPAQFYINNECGQNTQTVVYTLSNNNLYILTVRSKARFEVIKPNLDKIVTTLKFFSSTVSPQLSKGPTSGYQTACTGDAKQCPDGSWVGRSGPKCEFICPK